MTEVSMKEKKRLLFETLTKLGFISQSMIGIVTIEINLNQGITAVNASQKIKIVG